MSDPFDALRSAPDDGAAPDVRAIKARAGRIQRRRSVALVTGAAAVALIAFVGVVVRPGADRGGQQLADSLRESSPAPEAVTMEMPADSSANATVAEDSAKRSEEQQVAGGTTASTSSSVGAARSGPESDQTPITLTLEVEERTLPRGAEFTLKACNT
ncbi:MAG: hypothetical protein WD826_02370, partial [Actinomycetota bacterium]